MNNYGMSPASDAKLRGNALANIVSRLSGSCNELIFSHYYNPDTFEEDEKNYVGVVCKCLPLPWGLWFYPPEEPGYYKAVCPNCRRENGVITMMTRKKKKEEKIMAVGLTEHLYKSIAIDSLNDLKEFIAEASKMSTQAWARKNGTIVSCTSLLGLISIDTSTGFEVEYEVTETDFANYISKFEISIEE